MDGSQQERNLMTCLRTLGFVTIRAPGSGTGDWDQPDILASRNGATVVAELRSGDQPRNLSPQKMAGLHAVADGFHGAAVVAVRYKGERTFYLVPAGRLGKTQAGKTRIHNDPDSLPWDVAIGHVPSGDADADPGVIVEFSHLTDDDIRRGGTGDPVDQLEVYLEQLAVLQHRGQL